MDTRLPLLAATTMAAGILSHRAYDRYSRQWGATRAEREMPLPGDDFLPHLGEPATMAITVTAPPERVWPWLVQMGIDRAGFYTYTWLENGVLHLDVDNADRIVPEWQDIAIGDRFLIAHGTDTRPPFGPLVVAIEPNRALVLSIGETTDPQASVATWQFVLEPVGEGATRLLLRSRPSTTRPAGLKMMDAVLEPGYQYMDIGMLQGIRDRAERTEPPVPGIALA